MRRGALTLLALASVAAVAAVHDASGGRASLAPCSSPRLYFEGSYYRTLKLSTSPKAGRRTGAGTYVPCNGTAPVRIPLRRVAGVRPDVALRDAAYPHLLYVVDALCRGRGGAALRRCLHQAKPSDPIVPPPAFVVAEGRYTPLDYSSSCWFVLHGHTFHGSCIDYVWPPSSPSVVPVERGGTLQFQLGFEPRDVSFFLYSTDTDFEKIELPASAVTSLQVPKELPLPALFELRARGAGGEGAYVGRLVEAIAPPTG